MQRSAADRRGERRRLDHGRAGHELGERRADPAVTDRAALAQRSLERADARLQLETDRRRALASRGRTGCPGTAHRGELAHVDTGVRRVADAEQEDEAARGGEPPERAVDAGRAGAGMPVQHLGGVRSDRRHGVGGVVERGPPTAGGRPL